jgi:2'-5' RNA ligase
VLAVEIYLDAASEECVRIIWAALDARGVESLGSVPNTAYRPHVSLAVFGEGDRPQVSASLSQALDLSMGMPLTLASLGFFPTDEWVMFLGVTPTQRLLETHRRVHVALQGFATNVWTYYEPGNFVPHCTLALGSHDAAAILDTLRQHTLPVQAAAAEAHLVEISTGTSLTQLA